MFLPFKRLKRAALLFLLLLTAGLGESLAQPQGALNGMFSVNDSTQVQFSQGNLQYQASTNIWRFADNQWDCVGANNANISETYDGWIDLFGWGTSGYNHGANAYQPWSTSTNYRDYWVYGQSDYNLYDGNGLADWGFNAISNGGNTENSGWRTLTRDEWGYVFNSRNTTFSIRYAKAKVNDVNGVILLPDNWDVSVYALSNPNDVWGGYDNTISAADWTNTLEANGAVFLPATGERYGASVSYAGDGRYWSAYHASNNGARIVSFGEGFFNTDSYGMRYEGYSVRLVRSAESTTSYEINATPNPTEGGTIEGTGSYDEGETCTLTATHNEGYTFINWTENGEVVSTEDIYSFTVTRARSLVANFFSLHWLPNTADYEENMPVTAVVEIDGEEQQSTTLELGAFSGEECRGSQIATYFEPTQRYIYQMTVFGEEGDEIAFRLYDHATQQELDLVPPEAVTFDALGYGTLPAPVVLNFRHSYEITATAQPEEGGTVDGGGAYLHGDTCTLTATPNDGYVFVHWTLGGEAVSTEAEYSFTVTAAGDYVARFDLVQATQFSQGWNWWSTFIECEDADMLSQLESGLGEFGQTIKSQSAFVNNSGGHWNGSLSVIENERSYRVKTGATVEVSVSGVPAQASAHPITLNPGWTWMGYPWSQGIAVEDALESFEPEANDLIKGRTAYTMYYAENGYNMWFGPLNSLEPGQGYVYYSHGGEAKTLTLNTDGGRSARPNVTAEGNLFRPEAGDYADNMTLTAVVELDGTELRSGDYEVAAFCGGECRGSAKLIYFAPTDSHIAFLTLYGNEGDEMEFVLTGGDMIALSGSTLRFATDGSIGTLSEPYPLCFGFTGVNDNASTRVSVYPNPSKDVFNIKGEGIRRVDVFNAFGQVVFRAETSNDTFSVDLSDKAAGVYLLRVVTESGVTNQQLIKE